MYRQPSFPKGTKVTLKVKQQQYMELQVPGCSTHVFEVYKEMIPGHIHARSIKDPRMLLRGFQVERFELYQEVENSISTNEVVSQENEIL